MKIADIMENEAGIIERLVDTTDPDMVDDIRKLFAEVQRAHAIEDAALLYRKAWDTASMIGEERAAIHLFATLDDNPRPRRRLKETPVALRTWHELITEAMGEDDNWDSVIDFHPLKLDFDRQFDAGFGGAKGEPFTLWTRKWVYFPVTVMGAERVARAPRNPAPIAMRHVGGE